MKKTLIYALAVIFFISLVALAFGLPSENKDKAPSEQMAQQASQQPQAAIPVIPKPKIPRITVRYDTPDTPQAKTPPEAKEGAIPQQTFGMAGGELISVSEKDPNTIELKIKTQEGKEMTISADSHLDVTKRLKLTDLKRGEKLIVHYISDETAKKNTALYVSAGEAQQFAFPPEVLPQVIPPNPAEKPKK